MDVETAYAANGEPVWDHRLVLRNYLKTSVSFDCVLTFLPQVGGIGSHNVAATQELILSPSRVSHGPVSARMAKLKHLISRMTGKVDSERMWLNSLSQIHKCFTSLHAL